MWTFLAGLAAGIVLAGLYVMWHLVDLSRRP